jgi:hypothetical protein
MTRGAKIIIAAVVLAGIGFLIEEGLDRFHVPLPAYPAPAKSVWLNQNWQAEEREIFHHADQGAPSFIVPYEWFVALEQPIISLSAVGLLSDPLYLDRFGFIPGNTEDSAQTLPIGFARGAALTDAHGARWQNPQTKEDLTGIGLTCAACHTGRFTYRGTSVLIDGAPGLIDLGRFQVGLGLSVLFTRILPGRFDRFAERVLGPGASAEAKASLRAQLDETWGVFDKIRVLTEGVARESIEEGFGRVDALNRIGNQVFALGLGRDENFVGTTAPVHIPRIWNTHWFDWVQYNGSSEQPLGRNVGEALGVGAKVNLSDPAHRFDSSIEMDGLIAMEQQLAGPQPTAATGFSGLKSPTWPADILPPIDQALAAKGAGLYKEICQECHLPPVASPEFWASDRWLPPNAAGERYLQIELIRLSHIGTDPAQATDMQRRTIAAPDSLGLTSDEFGLALADVVEGVVERWFAQHDPPLSDAERHTIEGNRPPGVQAVLKYKVRPLNGVWATPPYLHNGSVPNLYALLSPVAERPKQFYMGSREYDPVNVGYESKDALPGGFLFDTSIRGNRNTGHEFDDQPKDAPPRQGVIGRRLSPDERRALIEFIKTQ